MKAAIYARYSAGPGQTDQSIEGQVRVCRSYADEKGLSVIGIYADRHISGTSDKRPEFQRLIGDAKAGLFDAVIVYKTDRFARDRYDSAVYKRELRKAGVRILYAAEPIPEGPEGVILEGLLESMAEYYSKELAQKVRRGMNENALKAKSTGGTRVFGYKTGPDRNIIIEETEAAYVREIFRRYIGGESTTEIAEWLNSRGVTTTRGNRFSTEAVNKLIRARKYMGEYKYSTVILKDAIPAIVTPEVFEKAQEVRATKYRPHRRRPETYLLAGKIFCGLCGHPVHGVSGTSKSGKIFNYYICASARKKACELPPVPKDALEDLIFEYTEDFLFQRDIIKDLTEKICQALNRDTRTEQAALEKAIAENTKAQESLVRAIETGAPPETLVKRLRTLEAEAKLLARDLQDFQKAPAVTEDEVLFVLTEYAAKDKKEVLTRFVNRVELFPDKIIIYYNIGGPDGGFRQGVFDSSPLWSTKDLQVELSICNNCLVMIISRTL